jgi:hypothetical protein
LPTHSIEFIWDKFAKLFVKASIFFGSRQQTQHDNNDGATVRSSLHSLGIMSALHFFVWTGRSTFTVTQVTIGGVVLGFDGKKTQGEKGSANQPAY